MVLNLMSRKRNAALRWMDFLPVDAAGGQTLGDGTGFLVGVRIRTSRYIFPSRLRDKLVISLMNHEEQGIYGRIYAIFLKNR